MALSLKCVSRSRSGVNAAPPPGNAILVVLLAALLSGCGLFPPSGNPHVPLPAKPVDLTRYLGLWYEQARYDVSFERGCEAVTAAYTARPDGKIGVVNTCHTGGVTGPATAASGRAYVVPGSGNARLKVSFFGPFYIGTYWVLDHADDYSWSIVGEPSGAYLWILTRAAHPAPTMRAARIARAQALGYDTSRLHLTLQ
jgi:apolipoprotein D and lipocalin family protein